MPNLQSDDEAWFFEETSGTWNRRAGPPLPGGLTLGNPLHTAALFYAALVFEPVPNLVGLRTLCTPQLWPTWGNFRQARELLEDRYLVAPADYVSPFVARVRFVAEDEGDAAARRVPAVTATLMLSRRSRIWQVHALGPDLPVGRLPY